MIGETDVDVAEFRRLDFPGPARRRARQRQKQDRNMLRKLSNQSAPAGQARRGFEGEVMMARIMVSPRPGKCKPNGRIRGIQRHISARRPG